MTARQISLASTAGHTALFRLFQQAADGTLEPSCHSNFGRPQLFLDAEATAQYE